MGLATDGLLPFQGFIRRDISSRSRVHHPGYAPCIPPHKPPPYTILLACLTSKPLFFKKPFPVSINLFRCLPNERLPALSYIDSLTNPTILHPLQMAEPSENTFINLFVYTLRHPAQLPDSCIQGFTTLILDFSFSLHTIFSLP